MAPTIVTKRRRPFSYLVELVGATIIIDLPMLLDRVDYDALQATAARASQRNASTPARSSVPGDGRAGHRGGSGPPLQRRRDWRRDSIEFAARMSSRRGQSAEGGCDDEPPGGLDGHGEACM